MDVNIDITSILKSIPLFFDLKSSQLESVARISDLVEIDPGDQPIVEGRTLDFILYPSRG